MLHLYCVDQEWEIHKVKKSFKYYGPVCMDQGEKYLEREQKETARVVMEMGIWTGVREPVEERISLKQEN